MIYNLSLLLILALNFFIQYSNFSIKLNKRKTINIINAIILFIPIGFRNITVGTDTSMYVGIYESIAVSRELKVIFEPKFPLYSFILKVTSMIYDKSNGYMIITGLLTMIFIGIFIYNNSKNIAMSWFYFVGFGYFFYCMNQSRQILAISIAINMLTFLNKKKYFKALLTIIVASLIHTSALIFLIVYIIAIKELTVKRVAVYISLFIFALALFSSDLFKKLVDIFIPKYSMYLTLSIFTTDGDIKRGNVIMPLIYIACLVCFAIYCHFNPKATEKLKSDGFFINTVIMVIAVIICVAFIRNEVYLRLSQTFTIFIIIYMPNVIETCFNKSNRIPIYIFSALVLITPYLNQQHNYLPYSFFVA